MVAADPTGAVASLIVPGVADPSTEAQVLQVEVSADGSFVFEKVPSPAQYQLVIEKPGFATEVRDLVVSARADGGRHRGAAARRRRGDQWTDPVPRWRARRGDDRGHRWHHHHLDGQPDRRRCRLLRRSRPADAGHLHGHLHARRDFTSESRTIVLAAAQQVGDTVITLAPATGSITGTGGLTGLGPSGGITVTITGGDVSIKTLTASTGDNLGQFIVESLPVPATYTITFSRPGYVSQTRLEDLDPLAGTGNLTAIDATLVPATATIRGVVRQVDGTPVPLATISLTDGANTLRLLSAHDPVGQFEFANVAPGTYTLTASLPGTSPAVVLVNVTPAEVEDVDIRLEVRASLLGQVQVLDPTTQQFVPYSGATVRLFLAGNFPGAPSQSVGSTTTDAQGRYVFTNLEAPENYVVAVYPSATAADPLDSELVQTVPSQAVQLPVFQDHGGVLMRARRALTPLIDAAPGDEVTCRVRIKNDGSRQSSYRPACRRLRRRSRADASDLGALSTQVTRSTSTCGC